MTELERVKRPEYACRACANWQYLGPNLICVQTEQCFVAAHECPAWGECDKFTLHEGLAKSLREHGYAIDAAIEAEAGEGRS